MTGADVAAYHEHFPAQEGTISGEWTGRYMFDAWTPPLLRRAAPDAKLLVMLSDPIERYRAIFTDRLAKRAEGERLYTADVVDRRSFGAQLARLRRFYDADRILVLQYERCRRDPVEQYRRTLAFLGVRDTGFVPRRLGRKAAGKPESTAVAALLRLGLPVGRRRRVAERLAGRPVDARRTAPLWPDLEAALHTALDPDVEALRALVPELDLTLWPNFARLASAGPAPGVRLLERAPDPLARHLPARAERLREMAHAQLLEHPRHLAQRGRERPAARPAGEPARVLGLQLVHRAHAVEVRSGRVRQPLEPARGRAQVALDVGQPAGAGRADEAGEHEPPQLALDVLARRRQRGRRCERREQPLDRARGVEDATTAATTCAVRSARLPATCARSRAKPGSSQAGPPASAISASSAATVASSSTARGLACGAPASASCAALPSRPWT